MAPKKSKQEKMSIGDFLNDQTLGSWADEMETQPMPSASASSFGGERRNFSSGTSSFGADKGGDKWADRGFATADRPFREELPLPTRPPYTAHLGNLSFEVTEGDVRDFMADCQVTSVRLVEDKLDMKPKGFGYVEFGSLDGLKKALTLTGSQFQGRNIRISIAEPPKDRGGEAREITDWTRKGPLPDLPGSGMRNSSERSGSFNRGFDPASDAAGDRGPKRSGFFEGDGKTRDFANWERKGPLSPPPGAEPSQGGRGPRGPPPERRDSPAWGEGTGRSEGSRPPRPERAPTAADSDSQWRARMKPDAPSPVATPDASVPSSPQASAAPIAPVSRPRLNLAKRTVSEAPPAEGSPTGSSIFGGAKPVDTHAREAEMEKKRQEANKAKKDAEEKAREEKRTREAAAKSERLEKDARESPRENGKPSERKGSDAAPAASKQQQYEILRRTEEGEEGEGDHDAPDASANGDIVQDKETKPQEVVREVPKGDSADASGGAWRKQEAAAEPSSQELEDDGFTVVTGATKKGKRGGSRALAS